MRVALPVWKEGISPVFDVAGRLLVVEREGEGWRRQVSLREERERERAARLAELGVEVLICGGISHCLEELLRSHGIEVVAWIRGEPEEVLNAYLAGRLDSPDFAMPGSPARAVSSTRQEALG